MAVNLLRKWSSWIWPVTEANAEGLFGPLTVRWESGQLVLNSDQGNQSFGSLHRVWQKAFESVGLRENEPANVLLLGLGAGSVPHIIRHELDIPVPITAIEMDPSMLELGRDHFGLGAWHDLRIIEGNATVQVHALQERFDLVIVDLFEDLDLARGVDTAGFAHALRQLCTGTVLFNTLAFNDLSDVRCDRVRENLERVFNSVDELRLEHVNRVFIAR